MVNKMILMFIRLFDGYLEVETGFPFVISLMIFLLLVRVTVIFVGWVNACWQFIVILFTMFL
jgi:hypothetical protein